MISEENWPILLEKFTMNYVLLHTIIDYNNTVKCELKMNNLYLYNNF